jgi:hypothetical protein
LGPLNCPRPPCQPLSSPNCPFQGPEISAGLPLAATMGRLADMSPCPVGACQRLEANQTHGNLGTRAWTPFPNFLGGQSFLPVTQGAKSIDFQRPAFPTSNSASRNLRGPVSGHPQSLNNPLFAHLPHRLLYLKVLVKYRDRSCSTHSPVIPPCSER